jgi:hypothetical protein
MDRPSCWRLATFKFTLALEIVERCSTAVEKLLLTLVEDINATLFHKTFFYFIFIFLDFFSCIQNASWANNVLYHGHDLGNISDEVPLPFSLFCLLFSVSTGII